MEMRSTNSNGELLVCIRKRGKLYVYQEFSTGFLAEKLRGRDVEADAEGAELPGEKIYNVEGEPI